LLVELVGALLEPGRVVAPKLRAASASVAIANLSRYLSTLLIDLFTP
jgi:hypothetical protein